MGLYNIMGVAFINFVDVVFITYVGVAFMTYVGVVFRLIFINCVCGYIIFVGVAEYCYVTFSRQRCRHVLVEVC